MYIYIYVYIYTYTYIPNSSCSTCQSRSPLPLTHLTSSPLMAHGPIFLAPHVEYAERRITYCILFRFRPFHEYSNLE